jgi:hypothetical protein
MLQTACRSDGGAVRYRAEMINHWVNLYLEQGGRSLEKVQTVPREDDTILCIRYGRRLIHEKLSRFRGHQETTEY